MRKDNSSRRTRAGSNPKKTSRNPFIKRSNDKTSERRPFSKDKPFGRDGDKPVFRKRDDEISERPRFDEGSKPKRAPLSFDEKKKYNDRSAKIEKNKRKRDFGQAFVNKDNDKKFEDSRFSKDRKPYTREKGVRKYSGENKQFRRDDTESSTFQRERKPYAREDGEYKYDGEKKPFRRDDRNKTYGDRKPFRRDKSYSSSPKENSTGLIRLNKYISNSGICSRREADDMIAAGVISVNGEIVTKLGTKISSADVVKYNNETMRRERNVYLLLNKPKDFITTVDDPENRSTVMNLIEGACKERVYPVGRLDRNTTGVLLFTNDGELTKRLTHPSSNIKKIYHVELDKNVTPGDIIKISEGVNLDDGRVQVDAIAYDHPSDKTQVGIELHSGKNRVVRRIFEELGYNVKKLDRVFFAGLTKKDLPRGRWRFLTEMEVNMLKMQTGKKRTVKDEDVL
jgi:23S rRNA pseudouridine2605 synthase